MATRRASSWMPQLSRTNSRLSFIVCIALCVLAFPRLLHSDSNLQSSSFATSQRRSPDSIDSRFLGPSKVAFLFLIRRDLPLDFLWGTFFKNGDAARFFIYVHSEPGFVLDKTVKQQHFRHAAWGEASMKEAERLLFEEALYDPANQRFVLLSDSCVPLYNFSYIYDYVISSPKSFVDSFTDVEGGRYDAQMSPTIP